MVVKILKGGSTKLANINAEGLSLISDSIRLNGVKYDINRVLDLDNDQIILRVRSRRGRGNIKNKTRGRVR